MDLIHPQLAAFAAVLEEGSFEAAARRLCVTASAVSQRIKALEDRLGQVLVVRQPPCRPTPAGALLLRRVRPMQLLETEALADFLPEHSPHRPDAAARPIAIAVNSDSLDTWVLGALAQLHEQHGYLFDVRVDDQDHTLDLLRDGSVLGVVTADGVPVQGCAVQALGAMRYQAIAAPEFAARYFSAGVNAATLARAPMIVFNRKDALQWRFVRHITRARLAPPIHYLPTATGFVDAAALGLGWCLAPDALVQPAVQAGRVVCIAPGRWLDVPLHWQHAAVRSDTLQRIGMALGRAAGAALQPLPTA
ncbi:LysR family transcriptional regulator ArgP [Comamonas nitrativorans]|uniref:LysR family transcriptional regulator ArgP n=1 Tax=Comamonas nitrativorans TaxID=108437 RepID=A0ABV9GZ92_9BURK